MTISAALVLFAVIWFMCLFIILPLKIKSQGEDGKIVPGTPASAPSRPQLKRKTIYVTIISLVLWIALIGTNFHLLFQKNCLAMPNLSL